MWAWLWLTSAAWADRPGRAPFDVTTVSDQARAKALVTQAERAEAEGRPADAAAAYARAWELVGQPRLLLSMADAYEAAGDWTRALDALDWYRSHASPADQAALLARRRAIAAHLVASAQ